MRLLILLGLLVVLGCFKVSYGYDQEENLSKREATKGTDIYQWIFRTYDNQTQNNRSKREMIEEDKLNVAYRAMFKTYGGVLKDHDSYYSECGAPNMMTDGEPVGPWSNCWIGWEEDVLKYDQWNFEALWRKIRRPLAYMVKYKYAEGVNPMVMFGRMSQDLGIEFYTELYHAVYKFGELEDNMKNVVRRLDGSERNECPC